MNKETRTTADIVFLFPPPGDLAKLWGAVPGRKPLTLALAELGYALARSNGRKVYLVDQKGDAQPLRGRIGDGPSGRHLCGGGHDNPPDCHRSSRHVAQVPA